MTKTGKIITLIVLVLIVLGSILFFGRNVKNTEVVDTSLPPYEFENEILGQKADLLNFTILPGAKMPNGILSFRGTIQGAWFFEGNILINILDQDKNILLASNAVATTDWMTEGPVDFEGNIDFTNLPKGPAYIEIRNDNPAGPDEGVNKFVLIPIIIE